MTSALVLAFLFRAATRAAEDHVVARVFGRPVLASEIRPSAEEVRTHCADLSAADCRRW
jgi:hypothetical protein